MIFYTPFPLEWVLEGYDSFKPQYEELDYGEGKLIVEMVSPNRGKIIRLISPCPEDYLAVENQPGREVVLNISAVKPASYLEG